VCDAVFDQQDAEVVCRELDCGAPVQVLGAAAFGKGDAQMWTQEIQCRGNESQIHLCPATPSHDNSCSHDTVGLICAGLELKPFLKSSIFSYFKWFCHLTLIFPFSLSFNISSWFILCYM